jgi:hypothetical protein
MQMDEPIAGATDHNDGGHGPKQQYWHDPLLSVEVRKNNGSNCHLFPT